MIDPSEQLQRAIGSRVPDPLARDENALWVRAGDLVVGAVVVTVDSAAQSIDRAYELLDNSRRLERHELWNVVLLVLIDEADSPSVFECARRVERDLRRSRKLAFTRRRKVSDLFSGIGGHALPQSQTPKDVVTSTLDRLATGELRSALEVLLKSRRSADEVNRLLVLLGELP